MPGSYPNYTENTQDTQYDIPGRKDLSNAEGYNDHDQEILSHQSVLINHEGRISTVESGYPIITSGSGAPNSTPSKIGDIHVDTSGKKLYFSVGSSSSADWEIAN